MGKRYRAQLIVAVTILAATGARGQIGDTLGCIDRLALPAYDPLARMAHVEGEVVAAFMVGKDGAPSEIAIDAVSPLLRRSLERYLVKSTFKRSCAGARLTLKVRFALRPPRSKWAFTEIVLIAPDRVEVISTLPELFEPQAVSAEP